MHSNQSWVTHLEWVSETTLEYMLIETHHSQEENYLVLFSEVSEY